MAKVRVRLLGRPSLEVDGQTRHLPGRKPWALLAILLLDPAGTSRRDLIARGWPEADDPFGALRWSLVQVRRAIAPLEVVQRDGRLVIADRGPAEVDAEVVLAGRCDATDTWVDLGPELLEGFDFADAPDLDRWLTLQRSRVRSAAVEALLWAATALATDQPARACTFAERALSIDPFVDPAHRLIVECQIRLGDRSGAAAYADQVTRLYRKELGTDPPEMLVRLPRVPVDEVEPDRAVDARPSGTIEARTLIELARARLDAGDYGSALDLGRRAASGAAETGDPWLEARAAVDLGTALAHSICGKDREADILLNQALRLAFALDDPSLAAEVEREIGYLHFLEADYGAAEAGLERAIALAVDAGDDLQRGRALAILGACRSDRADFVAAEPTLRSAIEVMAFAADERWPAYALTFLARLETRTGRPELGMASAAAAATAARTTGWLSLLPWPLAVLGESQFQLGQVRAASSTFGEAYALAREIDDPCWLGISLRGMALVARSDGDVRRASDLLGEGVRCLRSQPGAYAWAEALLLTDLVDLENGADPEHLEAAERIVTRGPMPDLAARLAVVRGPQTRRQTVAS